MGDVAYQTQRGDSGERVHDGSGKIRDNQHITFVNCLETTNAGAIEWHTFKEYLFLQFAHRHAEMLPGPWQVGEFEVYHLCVVLFGKS